MVVLAVANPSAELHAETRLTALGERWRRDDVARGGAFQRALGDFLAQLQSEHTRRAYRYAIVEFWDWYESLHGATPTPARVERRDAIGFADWLTTRQVGLDEQRLKQDPSRRLDAAIYAIVRARGSARIDDVRRALGGIGEFVEGIGTERRLRVEATDRFGLDRKLACLVEKKLLARDPSVEQLRQRDPTLYARLGERIDPGLFTYRIEPHSTARGAERASSVAARLTALSSFWSYLVAHTGENTGQKALLDVNVWQGPLKQVLSVSGGHREVTRAKKTPDMALFERLLDTTARAGDLPQQPLEDVRDRALLLFLFYTGVRAEELGRLRRSDLVGEVVTVIGKGRRARAFQVPLPARQALGALTSKLALLAADAERAAPGRMPRMARLLADDAPLFPAVARWGCNAYSSRRAEEPGISRQAIAMMLRRRGVAAGIAPGSPDFARLHPHGLRHLAAKTAIDSGTPVHVVQAVLGHKSLSTTGVYIEERDPRRLSLFQAPPAEAEVPPQPTAAPPARPAPRPPPTRPVVIETVGVSVPPPPAPSVAAVPARPPPALAPPPTPPPALPPSERLVALGKLAPLPKPLPSALEIARAPDFEEAYAPDTWGEGGKEARQTLREGRRTSDEDRLTHTYVGKRSGLVWWGGATGQIRPDMPVAAPVQFLRPGPYGDVRASLETLWFSWIGGTDPKHPPTSALALLEWVKQALEVSGQVDGERRARGGSWVGFDAPLELTRLAKGERARIFRVHREDMIARWFEVRGHTYLAAAGRPGEIGARIGQAVDKTPARPAGAPMDWYAEAPLAPEPWYSLEDPVAALPDAERAELIDWLLVLTGQPPMDKTRRFQRSPTDATLALSRGELASLLLMLCAYDDARDAMKEAQAEQRLTRADKEAVDQAAEMVDQTVAALTRGGVSPPFHVQQAVYQRIEARKKSEAELQQARARGAELPEEGETRESRSEHYLGILRTLFGAAAAEDAVLRLYSLCAKSQRLAEATFVGGEYKDFFRIDRAARTVRHTEAYKDEFARLTGADSECVARRVARHLWEQKRAGKTKRYDEHPSELLWQLNTWAFYKVPCAREQEAGLAARLRRLGKTSAAELTARLRAFAEERATGGVGQTELEEEARELARGVSGKELTEGFQIVARGPKAATPNARDDVATYVRNARALVPGPITLLVWIYA